MVYEPIFFTLFFIVLSINFVFIQAAVSYAAGFSDDVVSCEDFDNKMFQLEGLKLGFVKGNEDDEAGMGLSGFIGVLQTLDSGLEIEMKISKVLDIGKELMFSFRGDLCSSLEHEDAPWYPIVKSTNCTSCPISVKNYPIDDVKVSLACAQDVLCEEFCGEYEVEASIVDEINKLSCHILYITVSEINTDD